MGSQEEVVMKLLLLSFLASIFSLISCSSESEEKVPAIVDAVMSRDLASVQNLIKQKVELNITYQKIPLVLLAVGNGKPCSPEILQELIKAGIDIHSKLVGSEITAIHQATNIGNEKCFDVLVKSGIDVEAINITGANIIYMAAISGNVNVLHRAIKMGVDPDLPTVQGVTPLIAAVAGNHVKCVRVLLESNKVNPCHIDKNGNSAISIATQQDNSEIIQILPSC